MYTRQLFCSLLTLIDAWVLSSKPLITRVQGTLGQVQIPVLIQSSPQVHVHPPTRRMHTQTQVMGVFHSHW